MLGILLNSIFAVNVLCNTVLFFSEGIDLDVLLLIDVATRPCLQRWFSNETGWLASRDSLPCLTSGCRGCTSIFFIDHPPIQLRFHTFRLSAGEYVEIRQGSTAADRLIGRFTSNHRPGRVVEVAGNRIFVSFQSNGESGNLGFNFTFQPKGTLPAFVIPILKFFWTWKAGPVKPLCCCCYQFSKNPYTFLNMQRSTTKLCIHIHADIAHRSTVSDFKIDF